MKALIYDERICQIEEKEFPVAPPLIWVDVPEGTTTRDTYTKGKVVKYVPEPIPESKPDPIIQRINKLEQELAAYKTKVDTLEARK